jgi:aminotransferase
MQKSIAHRLQGLVQSDIRRMTRECERVKGINLGQGICDLPTPPLVRDGAVAAIDARKSTYSHPEGALELRTVIAEKLARDNGLRADPRSEIVVTVGATGAFTATIHALLDPGDGILLFEPYYGYHLNAAIVAGLVPQYMRLSPPGFALRESDLRAAIKPNTRAIVVCTPANPSGKMFDRAELEILARVAREKDLLVITDEIYENIRYDGRPHIPPASVGDLWERTVTIMGLSKTFSITGWRLGYAVARADLARAITLVNDLFYVCAPTPLQHGAAAGFRAPPSFFTELAADYAKKREMTCTALEKAGLSPIWPQGAYYVLAEISHLGFANAREAAMALLEEVGVATIPGTAFYSDKEGERFLRLCFAKEDDALAEACRRIERFRR